MRVDVLTLFPGAFGGPLDVSIIKRARDQGLLDLHLHDIREYARDRHRTVDDYPFGGGQGMVLKVDVLDSALEAVQAQGAGPGLVVYLSPQGKRLDDALVRALAAEPRLILVCGRYEGVDERFIEHCVDREVSIGDYVLTGGELPAMVLVDAVTRHIPGALGDDASPEEESFADGLLEHPQYTRPAEYRGWTVPGVLVSGHHADVARWKAEQRVARTQARRPDLVPPSAAAAPALGASFAVLDELFGDLLALLDRCDDACVNWAPLPGANPIGVLVRHALGSLEAWLSRAAGDPVTRDRDAEFVGGSTAAELVRLAEAAREDARARLRRLATIEGGGARRVTRLDRDLGEFLLKRGGPEDLTAAWCVEQALVHLGEHWGQALLTRTLYDARP